MKHWTGTFNEVCRDVESLLSHAKCDQGEFWWWLVVETVRIMLIKSPFRFNFFDVWRNRTTNRSFRLVNLFYSCKWKWLSRGYINSLLQKWQATIDSKNFITKAQRTFLDTRLLQQAFMLVLLLALYLTNCLIK